MTITTQSVFIRVSNTRLRMKWETDNNDGVEITQTINHEIHFCTSAAFNVYSMGKPEGHDGRSLVVSPTIEVTRSTLANRLQCCGWWLLNIHTVISNYCTLSIDGQLKLPSSCQSDARGCCSQTRPWRRACQQHVCGGIRDVCPNCWWQLVYNSCDPFYVNQQRLEATAPSVIRYE